MFEEDKLYEIEYTTKTGEKSIKIVCSNSNIYKIFFGGKESNSKPKPNLQASIQIFSHKLGENPKSDLSFRSLEKSSVRILSSMPIEKSILKSETKMKEFYEGLEKFKNDNNVENIKEYKEEIKKLFKFIINEEKIMLLSNYGDKEIESDENIYFNL